MGSRQIHENACELIWLVDHDVVPAINPPGFHMLAFIRSIDVAPKDEERSHGVPGGGVGGMGGMDM